MNDPLLLIRASAGSGKTYTLVIRFLSLLLRGVAPEKILASTFTREAAAEIRSRLFSQLALAAQDDLECSRLASATELPGLTKQQCLASLQKLVSMQHRLAIGTIDGIAYSIARCSGAEIGLAPEIKIIQDFDLSKLRSIAIDRLKNNIDRGVLLSILSEMLTHKTPSSIAFQVEQDLAALLELAAEIPEKGVSYLSPAEGLSDQQFEALSREIAQLQAPLTAKGQPHKNWQTALQRVHLNWCEKNWRSLVEDGLLSAVKAGSAQFASINIPDNFRSALKQVVQHLTYHYTDEALRRSRAYVALLLAYYAEYQACLHQYGAYGFSELKRAVANATQTEALEPLLYRLDSRFEHILLDEFQDTSRLDWALLSSLVDGCANGADSSRSFLCVGDPKQSIYGWRGGVVEIFDFLVSKYPALKQSQLSTTRRSSNSVIKFVNNIFKNLNSVDFPSHQVEAIEAWQKNFPDHSTTRSEVEGYVEVEECEIDDIFNHTLEKIKTAEQFDKHATIGVLFKTNKIISEFALFLQKQAPQIQFSREGDRVLVESPIIRLLLSTLRLIDHPGDSISGFHLSNSKLKDLFGDLIQVANRSSFSRKARLEISQYGLADFLEVPIKSLRDYCDENDVEALREFELLVDKFDPKERLSLLINRCCMRKYANPKSERIRLLTVHAAKGLEFDHVIIPFGNDKILRRMSNLVVQRRDPMSHPEKIIHYETEKTAKFIDQLTPLFEQREQSALTEALNVLYVSLTRARDRLSIILPHRPNQRSSAALLRNSLLQQKLPLTIGSLTKPKSNIKRVSVEKISIKENLVKPLSNVQSLASHVIKVVNPAQVFSTRRDLKQVTLEASRRRRSITKGVEMHSRMQQIEWLDEGTADLSSEFVELLSKTRFPASDKLELWRERRFAVRIDNQILNGRFDRVVLQRDAKGKIRAAEIIDYKSGSGDFSNNSAALQAYTQQLQIYEQALRLIIGESKLPIKMKLAFVDSGRVVEI